MAYQSQLIFNCTPTQFGVAAATTLPGAGFTVLQVPVKFRGIIKGTSAGAAALGQIDFEYDGQYFLRFFGSNPIPTSQQTNPGVPMNNMAASLITYLTTTLAATLGAPVPPNLAVPPPYVP